MNRIIIGTRVLRWTGLLVAGAALAASGCVEGDEFAADLEPEQIASAGANLDPEPPPREPPAIEVCDCLDNDGDGYIDENLECVYEVAIELAADDEFDVYFDGGGWASSGGSPGAGGGWDQAYTFTTTAPSGAHHIAVAARDNHEVVAGFLATVSVNGALEYLTGSGDWRVSTANPGANWQTSTAGMGPTVSAASCRVSHWSSAHGTLVAAGAEWVWTADCDHPEDDPENYYVLALQVCPEQSVELCDGADNDGDGVVDEGFADTDGDGIADCVDQEECDCQDNDGDGYIDENLECEFDVSIELAADDEFTAYFDGNPTWDGGAVGQGGGWDNAYTFDKAAVAPGIHHIAVEVHDTHEAAAGFLSAVSVDGVITHLTDSGAWRVSTGSPGANWQTTTSGMAATTSASACASTYWVTGQAGLLATGARWVWSDVCDDPVQYPENYYVLELPVCPETAVEICGDCVDNDGDGSVDEGCPELCPVEEPHLPGL